MQLDKPDLIILGGGVAGLSAGSYAAWLGLRSVLVDRMAGAGGCAVNVGAVLNYPGFPDGISGPELGSKLSEHAIALGLPIEYGEVSSLSHVDGGYEVVIDGQATRARAVILAVGSVPVRLGCPGESELTGRGVSYCAICDGAFFQNQAVVVLGSGDSAVDEALHLAETSRVQLLVRGNALHAAGTLVKRAREHPSITIRLNTQVTAIEGDGEVSGVRVRSIAGEEERITCAGVFIYVGLRPDTSLYAGLVECDADGHVEVDLWMRTSSPGLFAVGDIRKSSARQLITGAGDGATAAIAAQRYLASGEWA